jgi:coenzyme F420-reducing hydrogenase gamma subunit
VEEEKSKTKRKTNRRKKPKVAVWKFASCDGCQLTFLNCEDELLEIADQVDIVYFREATRTAVKGPYDLSFVDGSITTPADAVKIEEIRKESKVLVSIGACATAGGIQALRNFRNVGEFLSIVYASPEYIDTLATSNAIAKHVPVDLELRGCPINKVDLIETIRASLQGRRPNLPTHSVCVDCKRKGNVCVMVTGTPCLGPVTQTGCGVLCPTYLRGCYGCFGPMETPNTGSLARWWGQMGVRKEDLLRVFRNFNADAEAFRKEGLLHEE